MAAVTVVDRIKKETTTDAVGPVWTLVANGDSGIWNRRVEVEVNVNILRVRKHVQQLRRYQIHQQRARNCEYDQPRTSENRSPLPLSYNLRQL